ncbi:CAZyme family CE3 [Trichoderma aggressivum f. europaeum]|uniref:CAZyme family CE3 n=1 Tax=Trichoderma aggressivum f. europaeum TaxID=173218 RepID=A0AAE1LYV6_9HYPO|nr:CAZyme family CE3 [Trichoderma aggressivum f. europaeum]
MVSQYQPDYILLELGFNDLGWFVSDALGTIQSMTTFIQNARAAKSDIAFAVATVPQRLFIGGRNDLITKTDDYNALLPALLQDLSTSESPIQLVLRESVFNTVKGEPDGCPAGSDGLHPNALGEFQIAKAFANALSQGFNWPGNAFIINGSIPTRACSTPANVVAKATTCGVTVTWDPVYGAYGYIVTSGFNGAVSSVLNVTQPTYSTTWTAAGIEWFYQVQAFCSDVRSRISGQVTATANPTCAPGPSNIIVKSTADGIDMTWDAVEGYDVDIYGAIYYDQTSQDFLEDYGWSGTSASYHGMSPGGRVEAAVEPNQPYVLGGYTSDVPCIGVTFLFPGAWNYEFCVVAYNGNSSSPMSECVQGPKDITEVSDCPVLVVPTPDPYSTPTVTWSIPGASGTASGKPPGSSSSSGVVVYIDPTIWNSPTPTAACEPPCTLVLPPWTLSSMTTITIPVVTETIEETWPKTTTGVVTYLTTTITVFITLPLITTSVIDVSNIILTTSTSEIVPVRSSIVVPPVVITEPTHGITYTYKLGPFPTGIDIGPPPPGHPGNIHISAGIPGPICLLGCGHICLFNCGGGSSGGGGGDGSHGCIDPGCGPGSEDDYVGEACEDEESSKTTTTSKTSKSPTEDCASEINTECHQRPSSTITYSESVVVQQTPYPVVSGYVTVAQTAYPISNVESIFTTSLDGAQAVIYPSFVGVTVSVTLTQFVLSTFSNPPATTTWSPSKTSSTPTSTSSTPYPTHTKINEGDAYCFEGLDGYVSFSLGEAQTAFESFCSASYTLEPGDSYGYVTEYDGFDYNVVVSAGWAPDQTKCGDEQPFPFADDELNSGLCLNAWSTDFYCKNETGTQTTSYGGAYVLQPPNTGGCILLSLYAYSKAEQPLISKPSKHPFIPPFSNVTHIGDKFSWKHDNKTGVRQIWPSSKSKSSKNRAELFSQAEINRLFDVSSNAM